MAPKVVLITGASSGIGLALAELLAKSKEYVVIATARKPEVIKAKGEAGGFHVKQLDVTDDTSVHKCIADTIKEHGRLDCLINNAGYGTQQNVEQMDYKDHEALFQTNYFGVVRMLKESLPHMRAAGKGQVIITTSLVGFTAFPFTDAYSASKFALEGLAEAMAPQLLKFGISISLVEPGPVSTPFMENIDKNTAAAKESVTKEPSDDYMALKEAFWGAMMSKMSTDISQTPEQVAEVFKQAVDDAKPHFRYQTSDYVREAAERKFKDASGDSYIQGMLKVLE